VRFRGGVTGGVGPQFLRASGYSLTGFLGAVDGHLGVQIRNLVGIYAVPHIAFGSWFGIGGPFGGFTGNVAGTVVVDFTIKDRFFAGVGAGGGIINAPPGAIVHVRVGGYPVFRRGLLSPRRKALSVAADLRTYFLSDATGTIPVINLFLGLGYEAF
jgi:hypothetical protein